VSIAKSMAAGGMHVTSRQAEVGLRAVLAALAGQRASGLAG